ncbi:MAG: hypothetical protein Kow0062_10560 [Acidobacteriota bacterium]
MDARIEPDGHARLPRALLVVFLLIALFVVLDLVSDWDTGVGLAHVAVEGVLLLAALGGAVALLLRLLSARRQQREAARRLAEARRHADRFRQETEAVRAGLGEAIARQFADWNLTAAESEVGLLLLKGLSFHEIAAVRGTSERTARQQARAIYAKAGLGGRSELSAFFLEDLLPGPEGKDGSPQRQPPARSMPDEPLPQLPADGASGRTT